MSSRAERQATAVWLLADAMANTSPEPHFKQTQSILARLWPHVLQKYDATMRRVQGGLIDFINEALVSKEDGHLSQEQVLGYLHMLTALVGDQWAQCPDKPQERKRNWRRLNNNLAVYIEDQDPTGEVGVEAGCRWAERVKEILRG